MLEVGKLIQWNFVGRIGFVSNMYTLLKSFPFIFVGAFGSIEIGSYLEIALLVNRWLLIELE